MSIHFLSGKPGGGKSLYAVRLCLDELLYGSRCIVTNLPLKLDELNSYLQVQFPDKSINLFERIILLDDATETGRFWTVRPGRPVISVLSKVEWERGGKPDYGAVHDGGVFYVIDEVHNFFNARAWMETGRDVLFYLSQHRKLGDTLIAVTQHVGNVDKQFRSLTQDYTYLRNLTKERMGLFRLPARFIRKTYLQPATDTATAMESGSFSLDVSGLARCYDTAAGVSIHGKAADRGERHKGLHWAWAVVGVPVAILLFLHFVPKVIGKVTEPPRLSPVVVPGVARVSPSPSSQPLPVKASPPVSAGPSVPVSASVPATNAIKVTGRVFTGRAWHVLLSDGRTVKLGDGHLTVIGDDFAVVDGTRYVWR
jgi:hypothetical protein